MKRVLLSLIVVAVTHQCFAKPEATQGDYTYRPKIYASSGTMAMQFLIVENKKTHKITETDIGLNGKIENMSIQNGHLYIELDDAGRKTKQKFDISNPERPKLIEKVNISSGDPRRIAAEEKILQRQAEVDKYESKT
jgi:hypothetical protein